MEKAQFVQFDPYNRVHLDAVQHLWDHGHWPEDINFVNVEDPNWFQTILNKMAQAWLKDGFDCWAVYY